MNTCRFIFVSVLAAGMMGQAAVPATGPATAPATLPARLAVPTAAARSEALALIQKLFSQEYAATRPADKAALAKRLLKEAAGTKDDMTARYVLLDQAALLAAESGEADGVTSAVEMMEAGFVMDGLARKGQLLDQCLNHVAGAQIEREVALAFAVMDASVARDDFTLAARMADVAEEAAGRKQNVAYSATIQPRLRDFKSLAEERGKAQAAEKTLAIVEDAGAHLVLGKYLALGRGDFERGLPHLARGNDAQLAAVAQADAANPTAAEAQVKVADLWWAIAQLQTDHHRIQAAVRAQYWYRLAKQTLTGITLTKINARLGGELPGAQAGDAAGHVDLLAGVDVDKDAVAGVWKRGEAGLVVAAEKYARLQLPMRAPDEYDLIVHFTRTQIVGHGSGAVAIMLTYKDKPFDLSLSDVGGTARLEALNKKAVKDNPTVVPMKLENNTPYVVTVQVRSTGVRALLDGKLLTEFKGDMKELGAYDAWKLKDNTLLGLGANSAGVKFEKVELVPITGQGRPMHAEK